jgi:multicomponent Na+:H+ antiporter subunit D
MVLVALGVSMLTLYSMTKIWAEAFWKDSPAFGLSTIQAAVRDIPRQTYRLLLLPIILLAVLTVVLGLVAEPIINLAVAAAEQLRNPLLYMEAVLGGGT